ncbi:putative phospholipase [Pseudomassariella vexata]|uniref:Putative phospholipase n=1 Tax=Pseudomassariella vexata TaxID=1141098 RepID=A0A1Y2EJX7_9PEZI|nr:putative phospholipase [Pseudomassariella vexata]ORY71850.1 putative phospholipase [Pseudomassariella vexata]
MFNKSSSEIGSLLQATVIIDEMDPVAELITSFNELNPSIVDELDEEPSPLEFMRFVARNTPFVVRQGAKDWTATKAWSSGYLLKALYGHHVNVAVTPFGNADASTTNEQGHTVFAKPQEEDQPFEEFLEYLTSQELAPTAEHTEVRYAQTQNDNLRHEYVSLFSEVEKSVPFARIALQKEPDAINMWIGNSKSVTALHRDNYENIYVQIAGQKHFVLLPALCQPCINEQELRPATYVRDGNGLTLQLEEGDNVPFATWDPDEPAEKTTRYSSLARPVRLTLNPGDMLYLPAMWYHKVSQSCSEDGLCVAVNYWYDMEFSGPLYPLTSFVRNINLANSR